MRDIAEIKADLAALDGVKGQGVKKGRLRSALIDALEARVADLEASPVAVAESVADAGDSGGWYIEYPGAGTNIEDTAEWRFVERTCAELNLNLTGGSAGDIVKKIYNQIKAKVTAWRMTREVVAEIGIGAEWPQFAALNRNPSTGAKLPAQPEPAPVEADPAATEAGMPIVEAPASASKSPEEEAIRLQVAAMVGARPEPARAEPAIV